MEFFPVAKRLKDAPKKPSNSILGHFTFRLNYQKKFSYYSIFLLLCSWSYSKVSHRLLFFSHFWCIVCIIYFCLSIFKKNFQSAMEGPYHQQLLISLSGTIFINILDKASLNNFNCVCTLAFKKAFSQSKPSMAYLLCIIYGFMVSVAIVPNTTSVRSR